MVDRICFIALILLCFLGFWWGLRIGKREGRHWIFPATGSMVIIVFYALLRNFPSIEFRIPLWLVPIAEIIWLNPFVVFFFAIASKKTPSRITSKGAIIICALIFAHSIYMASWVIIGPGVDTAKFKMRQGVCIQSTDYTCGAASAVTLLKYWGVDSDEREMELLSHTTKDGCVTVVSLARGIVRKLVGTDFRVDILRLDWDGLRNLKSPAIVDIGFAFIVAHMVVVLEVRENDVVIGDPLTGRDIWTKDEFLAKWYKNAIVVSKR